MQSARSSVLGIAIAGLALAGLALAGCSAPPIAPPTPATSTSTSPAHVAPGNEVDTVALLDAVAKASASIKTSKTSLSMETVVNGKPIPMTVEGVSDQSDPAQVKMSGVMNMGGKEIKIVGVGDALYMNSGASGAKWVKLGQSKIASQANKPALNDQGAVLASMKNSVTKAVYVGDEDVKGVKTKHYTLSVDQDALTGADTKTGKVVPYDLWLDANNLTRKFTMAFQTDQTTVTTEGYVTAYNEPVTIVVPDPSMVAALLGPNP